MANEPSVGKIYDAISRILKSLPSITEEGFNEHSKYSYITKDNINRIIREALGAERVAVQTSMLDMSIEHGATKSGGKQFYAKVKFRFSLIHAVDGSRIDCDWWGEALDTSDKAISKASTLGLKSWLKSQFLISSNENDDPDGESPRYENIDPVQRDSAKRDSGGRDSGKLTEAHTKAIKTGGDWEEYRQHCIRIGAECITVAENAWNAGCRSHRQIVDYALALPSNGPIEVGTLNDLTKLMLERKLISDKGIYTKAGSVWVHKILEVPEPDAIPMIRNLMEAEGRALIDAAAEG